MFKELINELKLRVYDDSEYEMHTVYILTGEFSGITWESFRQSKFTPKTCVCNEETIVFRLVTIVS